MADLSHLLSDGSVAGADIDKGLFVYCPTTYGTFVVCDDGANQAATQQLYAVGVSHNSVLSGQGLDVQVSGIAEVVAGTGGLAVGDRVVPEYATGRGIAISTIVALDRIKGTCVRAADAGEKALVALHDQTVTVIS